MVRMTACAGLQPALWSLAISLAPEEPNVYSKDRKGDELRRSGI
jgi:hypothetical protein